MEALKKALKWAFVEKLGTLTGVGMGFGGLLLYIFGKSMGVLAEPSYLHYSFAVLFFGSLFGVIDYRLLPQPDTNKSESEPDA